MCKCLGALCKERYGQKLWSFKTFGMTLEGPANEWKGQYDGKLGFGHEEYMNSFLVQGAGSR